MTKITFTTERYVAAFGRYAQRRLTVDAASPDRHARSQEMCGESSTGALATETSLNTAQGANDGTTEG